MHRAIEMVPMPVGVSEFDLELRDPGIVRLFLTGMREKSSLLVQGGKKVVEEIGMLLVEVDPTAVPRKRHFFVISQNQAIESTKKLVYRGTTQTPHSGLMFHLFEEVEEEGVGDSVSGDT